MAMRHKTTKGNASSVSRPAGKPRETERFMFRGWYAVGNGTGTSKAASRGRRLYVSEVSVDPNDRYCFQVWRGNRHVISFYFDSLPDAMRAVADMKILLPRIEALRRVTPRRAPASFSASYQAAAH